MSYARKIACFCSVFIPALLSFSLPAWSQSPLESESASSEAPAPAKPPAVEIAPKVALQIKELKRTQKNTLILKFSVSNNSAAAYDMLKLYTIPSGVKGGADREFSAVKLVETEEQKEHAVMAGGDNRPICSRGSILPKSIEAGESFTYWAQFEDLPFYVKKVKVVFAKLPVSQIVAIK
jgi:hypothetical protein